MVLAADAMVVDGTEGVPANAPKIIIDSEVVRLRVSRPVS